MTTLIQIRRGTAAQWALANTLLAEGEIGLVTDTGQYKIGDGVTLWNDLTFTTLTGTFDALDLTEGSVSSAENGHIALYAGSLGGRLMPRYVGPSGLDTALQPFIARNKVGYWCPPGGAATLPGVFGYTALTAVGTATTRTVTTTNVFTRMRRLGYVSAASAGSLASLRVAVAQVTTGTGSLGGFHKVCRFGISDAADVAGARMFVGMAVSTSAPTNVEPSTLTNCIGVGHRSADTNLHIFYGGSSAQTPINLGANFPSNTRNTDAYDLTLFAPVSGDAAGKVGWQVTRLGTEHVASGWIDPAGGVALPGSTTLMTYMWAYRTNNATALAVGLDLMSDYIETDY